ncbi:MAG TPA: B12-binding domain-containing protein [Mucilaginibacter sp.]|nr:B12-binding domain-containing protein [Mucilaginibacter sp.]
MKREEMEAALQQEIDTTVVAEKRYEFYIAQIISYTLAYNEHMVSQLINQSFEQNGVLETYKFVLYPLLVRVGLLWRKNSVCPSQEHFLSAIIRQKLYAAIDRCVVPAVKSSWLLFLPEDEDHDIGLLLASYLLRSAGHGVSFLGAKVPFDALRNTIQSIHPEKLLFFMTRIRPVADAQVYIDQLASSFDGTQIFVSGNPKLLTDVVFPDRCLWLKDVRELENIATGGK